MKLLSKPVISIFLFSAMALSCSKKKIMSEQGGIDILSNVYFDAANGLDNVQTFHVSKLNYLGNDIVELVPDIQFPEMVASAYYIHDSVYYRLDETSVNKTILSDLKKQAPSLLSTKTEGSVFVNEVIPNYKNRRNLSDTVLFKKEYKRFEINSPWTYTRFYIAKTDTILPYSLYKHAEEDYGGRLERIDSYDKKKDIFVTLQLIPRKNWDEEAKEFFDFNRFISKSKPKK